MRDVRTHFMFWPNVNGHGPYLRISTWAYPFWGFSRDIFDRWVWQWDLGHVRLTFGWL